MGLQRTRLSVYSVLRINFCSREWGFAVHSGGSVASSFPAGEGNAVRQGGAVPNVVCTGYIDINGGKHGNNFILVIWVYAKCRIIPLEISSQCKCW